MTGATETRADPRIERARKGDTRAWDALIALHGRRVMLVLLARGVRAARAEEIVQETWARLVAKSKEGGLERLELPGLAITHAVRASIDDQRADRTRRASSLDEPGERHAALDVADGGASPLDRLVSRAALERALAELERCPPRAREVFTLVYDNPELPHAEAAERAGLSVQRLRQTLCEVRARLRAAMVED